MRHGFQRRLRVRGLLVASLVTAVSIVSTTAHAGTFNDMAVCGNYVYKQAFSRWGDARYYTLAPGGAAEAQSRWTLSGGAKFVSGNEIYYLNSPTDKSSLSLPAGSSARTDPMCVVLGSPTFRFMVLNTGASTGSLKIDVLYENVYGIVKAKTVANISAGSSWNASVSLPVLLDADSLVRGDGKVAVAFRFTPQGTGASFKIDDVFVDPRVSR